MRSNFLPVAYLQQSSRLNIRILRERSIYNKPCVLYRVLSRNDAKFIPMSRPDIPKTATTENSVTKIHDLVLVYRRMNVQAKTVWFISYLKYWVIRKLSARLVSNSIWHCLITIRRRYTPETKEQSKQ